MENGKDWDCKVHGKHVENSANSTIYVLPKVLDVYYNLAVSQNGIVGYDYILVPLHFPYRQPLTEKSWTDKVDLFIHGLLPHCFGLLSPYHMTFQSLQFAT